MGRYGIKDARIEIQEAGIHAGSKALFVHFTDCNLWDGHPLHRSQGAASCARWCSADFLKGSTASTDELVERMGQLWPDPFHRFCVLTGGEPALQIDAELLMELHDHGWNVAVETNGTVENKALAASADWVCVSPKRGTKWSTLGRVDELVVALPGAVAGEPGWSRDELADAYVLSKKLNTHATAFFVRPQDPLADPSLLGVTYLHRGAHEMNEERAELLGAQWARNLKACSDWVLANPAWRLTQHSHKPRS